MSKSLDDARRRAAEVFPHEQRKQLSEAFADYEGQEVSGKYPDPPGWTKEREQELLRWFFGRFKRRQR